MAPRPPRAEEVRAVLESALIEWVDVTAVGSVEVGEMSSAVPLAGGEVDEGVARPVRPETAKAHAEEPRGARERQERRSK